MAIDRSNASKKRYTDQHRGNYGWDDEFQLPITQVVRYRPSATAGGTEAVERETADTLVTKIDEPTSSTLYIGEAAPGAASSAAVWRIQKITTSGNVQTFAYADGDSNFDNVWDNRASLSYS